MRTKKYYGVRCVMGCDRALAITSSTMPVDVEMPDTPIVCPICGDGCVYTQDRLISFGHLDLVANGYTLDSE